MGNSAFRKPAFFFLLILVGALLVYTPTRFFIKMTILVGGPFVLVFAWWRRQPRYSVAWVLSGVVLVSLLGVYGILVYNFQERLQIKQITRAGDVLLAEGRYDQAIDKYRELEPLERDKARKKIEAAEAQKEYYRTYLAAKELAERGARQKAIQLLQAIPHTAHVHNQAQKLLSRLKEDV
ncbi:MAG: hypothetical protein GXX09_02130 [Syntrophomonadaceae bacterium]|nr:hypothetical protein [Syntrophomonadaceae bacterium]